MASKSKVMELLNVGVFKAYVCLFWVEWGGSLNILPAAGLQKYNIYIIRNIGTPWKEVCFEMYRCYLYDQALYGRGWEMPH